MTTLYHFTPRSQLASIMSMGELLMTPNPHISVPGKTFPVLWFSTESGDGKVDATMATALNLDGAVQGRFLMNRTEFRIAVEVPDEEVQMWEDYAAKYDVPKPVLRKLAKWPKHPEWWVAMERTVNAHEWVEIAQGGKGTWNPLFKFDAEGQAVQIAEIAESEEPTTISEETP